MREKHETKICRRCSAQFVCKMNNIITCQCYGVSLNELSKAYFAQTAYDCLCANCMTELHELVNANPLRIAPNPSELIENKHYYMENGFFVFTELYHYLKGQCCGNRCRHCAYGKT
jgi:uncharacterized protein YuzB (UPF0349 family)